MDQNINAYYIYTYRQSCAAGKCLVTTPDHDMAVRLLQSLNDIEAANYRRARRRRHNRERPRRYFISFGPAAKKGVRAAVNSFHRWAYWYYAAPSV